jgi:hypothetical protein
MDNLKTSKQLKKLNAAAEDISIIFNRQYDLLQ